MKISAAGLLLVGAGGAGLLVSADVCDTFGPTGEQMNPPDSPADRESWLEDRRSFRTNCLQSISYNGSIYEVPEIQWTQTAFMQPQMHPYDLYFYTPERGYDVSGWLSDLNARYGGIDAALVWPTYTNIGIDSRSQFDYITALPGGIDAITKFSAQLQDAGVRVLWPYNPWDTGSSRDSQHRTDAQILAWLANATNTDGFNGDTMPFVDEEFFQAAKDLGHPIAIEPEGGGIVDSLNWDTMGWGYWNYNSVPPPVSKWKWLEPRFLTNVCDRWAKNKTNNLQYAWFNGAGYETWENVWGTWNEIVPADGEAIRRVATMLRFFGAHGFITSQEWAPFYPTVQADAVFATQFPLGPESLWTIVNRGGLNSTGAQLVIPGATKHGMSSGNALHYYDCYHGTELKPAVSNDGNVTLSFDIEANGYGCVFASPDTMEKALRTRPPLPKKSGTFGAHAPPQPESLDEFLSTMKNLTQRHLASFRKEWTFLHQQLVPSEKTRPAGDKPRPEMVRCEGGPFEFVTDGVEIEGAADTGVDVQFPWETRPSKTHASVINVPTFDIDVYPVTVANYSQYLTESKYLPKNAHNWLKDKSWKWPEGKGPIVGPYGHGPATVAPSVASEEAANRPVVHVSLAEARAYCKHYGKRLPQVWEWQYAAQGGNASNTYPWGPQLDPLKYPSIVSDATETPPRKSVHAFDHAKAASPFGVKDLIGNIWQYTTEVRDIHTRAVVLKGAANYYPDGSKWYFPQALELNKHNKYFLMDDSYERAATLGFRCVEDVKANTSGPSSLDCRPSDDDPLCARLVDSRGYIDLTADTANGGDWMHFGDDIQDPSYITKKSKRSDKAYFSNFSLCDSCMPLQQTTAVLTGATSWSDGPSAVTPSGQSVRQVANTTNSSMATAANGEPATGTFSAVATAGTTAEVNFYLGLSDMAANFSAVVTGQDNAVSSFTQILPTPPSGRTLNTHYTLQFVGPATLSASWSSVAPPSCDGTLCSYFDSTQECGSDVGSTVDLTVYGHDDWVKFHTDVSGDGVTRKDGGGQQIQASLLPGSVLANVSDSATNFKWEDGDATAPTGVGDNSAVAVQASGDGFQIQFPVADAGTTEAQVWLGAMQAAGTFVASLSDGSAPDVNLTVECQDEATNIGITLIVKGAAEKSNLLVTYTQETFDGTLPIQAAAVSYFAAGSEREARARQRLSDSDGFLSFQAATITIVE